MLEQIKNTFSFLEDKGYKIIKQNESNYSSFAIYRLKSLAIYIHADSKERIVRVYIMKLNGDVLPNIDDSENVILLEALNRKYLPLVDPKSFQEANNRFKSASENTELMKHAKTLYLILDLIDPMSMKDWR